MSRAFGPKSDKIGAYRAAFVHQVPFEKDSSSAPRVINEVVLDSRMNKPLGDALCFFKCQHVRDQSVCSSLQKFYRDEAGHQLTLV